MTCLQSSVPKQVRDALVCTVAQLVFAGNVTAVARTFGDLQLLPEHVLRKESERTALTRALTRSFADVLEYTDRHGGGGGAGTGGAVADDLRGSTATAMPRLRFDRLLASLSVLVTRFQFTLPPYFLNNARALATIEGIARNLDPSFSGLPVRAPASGG